MGHTNFYELFFDEKSKSNMAHKPFCLPEKCSGYSGWSQPKSKGNEESKISSLISIILSCAPKITILDDHPRQKTKLFFRWTSKIVFKRIQSKNCFPHKEPNAFGFLRKKGPWQPKHKDIWLIYSTITRYLYLPILLYI